MSNRRHRRSDARRAETDAYILTGPTAVGKSAVAQRIAERWGVGILSADSMLVYRGMDVGTDKPSAEDRGRVAYRGLDLVSPAESFSVGAYLGHAAEALAAAAEAGRPWLVTGGTGLYLTALLEGLAETDRPDPEIRARVRAWYDAEGVPGLVRRLHDLAPKREAALADPHNPRRLMRALELCLGGGGIPQGWRGSSALPGIVGLRRERTDLDARIHLRVRRMFEGGLLEEAARLRREFPEISLTARQAIGYAEAFAVLDGQASREEAEARTIVRTRQLAKRQMTWFRGRLNVTWIDAGPEDPVDTLAERVIAEWERTGPAPVRADRTMRTRDRSGLYDALPLRVRELPRSQQPRELVDLHGPASVQDEVLIAVLLRTGLPHQNVLELARGLLRHYGSLTEMARASVEELRQHPGMGPVKAQILKCALELGRRLAQDGLDRPTLRTPQEVFQLLAPEACGLDREHFWVLLLDTRYRLVRPPRVITKGILDASLVHAREVFKEALAASSAALILAHNHPSGDPTPSAEDIRVTRKLIEAGRVMGIDVLDHVVLGRPGADNESGYTSLRESGLVVFE